MPEDLKRGCCDPLTENGAIRSILKPFETLQNASEKFKILAHLCTFGAVLNGCGDHVPIAAMIERTMSLYQDRKSFLRASDPDLRI